MIIIIGEFIRRILTLPTVVYYARLVRLAQIHLVTVLTGRLVGLWTDMASGMLVPTISG